MSARNVPAELLITTFRLLERRTLGECMFVCKTWHSLITPLHFEEVPLNAYTILLVKSQLDLPEQERKEYFQNGIWVKKLTIQFDNFSSYKSMMSDKDLIKRNKSFKLKQKELWLLLSYFPNLRVIDATDSNHFIYYMECLADYPSQDLPRLEEIPCDMHESSFLPNLAACYNYRQSLTHLKTVYNASSLFPYTYHDQTDDDTFISLLSGFKNLTHLDFYNETSGSKLTPFHIQNICPNLIQFKFSTQEYLYDNELPNNNQTHSKLKQLEISVPALSASYIKYIAAYIPKNLEYLCINLKMIDFCDWILQIGDNTADQFARFLSKIKNSRIVCSMPMKEYQRDPNGLKMTLFYRFLGLLKGDRDMYCTASYDDFYPNETEIRVIDNKFINFRYGLDYEDYNYTINEGDDDGDRYYYPSQVFNPDIRKSVIGPEIINNLAFTMRRENEDTLYQVLKYALTNCPHLHRLELENNTSQIFGSPPVSIEECNPFISKHDALKKFKFVGSILSNDIVDLLSKNLPGVQEIITELGDEYSIHRTKDLKLDVTGLKHLNRLCLDTRTMIHSDLIIDDLFIDLNYAQNNDMYFNIQKKQTEIADTMDEYSFVPTTRDVTKKSSHIFSIKCNQVRDIAFTFDNYNTIISKFKHGKMINPDHIKYWGCFFQSAVPIFK